MDAAAELGRNPVSKHQIQPEYGDEQADAGRDCRTRLARPNSPARTKVNGSHHGDNPLLGPTGIQIATKSYATLQAMAPTNNKTVHQTSFTPYRKQPRSTRIVVAYPRLAFQPVLINNIKSFSRPHIVQK